MTSSSGKKVIIVGASSGIGRELAILYANAGWQVGITGRRSGLLNELADRFPGITTNVFDVTKEENIRQLERLIEQLGGLDLFIYNAGYGEISDQLDEAIDRATVRTNVNGFAEMVNFAFRYFCRQGRGQIAATSSVAAMGGNHFAPAYSASKAFMSNYMEGLFLKAKKKKLPIIITDIQPGFVKTKMAQGPGRFWEAPPEKAARQMVQAIEAGKFRVYITHRWRIIAQLINWMPGWLYRKIG